MRPLLPQAFALQPAGGGFGLWSAEHSPVLTLMRDMRDQGAAIFAVANIGDETVKGPATDVIPIEETREALMPICDVIPLQLLSYFMAINNGIDVDIP